MSARQRRTPHDERRRGNGQKLLVDGRAIARAVEQMAVATDECVVEIGPGRGALTIPLARAGARVIAVERDAHMLDHPPRGPWRADVLVQREVAHKRAANPPTSLRSAAWAPWWTFAIGEVVSRTAFRPVPRVDAAWLTVVRRDPPMLPPGLAPTMRDTLRPAWQAAEGIR